MSKSNKTLNFAVFETPLGWMGVVGSENGLRGVILPVKSRKDVLDLIAGYGCRPESHDLNGLSDLVERLERYFRGENVDFLDILDLVDVTNFERSVWKVVRSIPRGQTRSYGWIAKQVGLPNAARAVGSAVGKNPVPIVIPCHRVIKGDGTLGGFGGDIKTKKFLLRLESQLKSAI